MESKSEMPMADFKRYLLGSLSPPETETIDLQIIEDENSEEKLLWAESDLIEDYLDETLAPSELELFESNFLVTPERRAQLKQIALIRNYASRVAPREVVQGAEKAFAFAPDSFLKKAKKFFSSNWRPLTVAAALVVVVGVFAVFYLTANRQTAAEKEFAALNQKDLSDAAQWQSLSNLNLISAVYRDSGGAKKLAENRITERVLFRLALPVQSSAADKFKAELVKNGKIVFTLDKLPFYQNPNGQEMRLLLPASELKKGAYQIKITKEAAPESIFIYQFAIE